MLSTYEQEAVLCAYNRARSREYARSGISWPIVRPSSVGDDGFIYDTSVIDPARVARWRTDALGRLYAALM